MATELIKPPIPACHVVVPATPKIRKMIKNHKTAVSTHLRIKSSGIRPTYTIKAAEQTHGLVGNVEEDQEPSSRDYQTVSQIKSSLNKSLQGINRGIFGVPSAKKSEIEGLIKLLESQNPTPYPTENLEKVGGCWKLIYTTISILGSKRTKLGLRDFITLGDFFQIIDVAKGRAVNEIKFNARGLKMLNGQLTIDASFKIASKSRVDIKYENSTITPDQLMNVFRKNYDLLLGIFNPEGWLEISYPFTLPLYIFLNKIYSFGFLHYHDTIWSSECSLIQVLRYVDETTRIGRDDKGNIFILERSEQQNP